MSSLRSSPEFTDVEIWLLAVITGMQQAIVLKPYAEQPEESQKALNHLIAEGWICFVDDPKFGQKVYYPTLKTAQLYQRGILKRKFKIWKLKREIEALENEEIEDGSKS